MSADVRRVIAERYRLDRLIGQGGMGSVFAAFDLRLERPVAVKMIHAHFLDDAARARFLREARAAAQIQSPHAVAIYDVGTEGEEVYLVQEFLSGSDLVSVLLREGPLDPRRVVALSVQICKALSVSHGAGIIHRDIKPSNLFVVTSEAGDERVLLLDFGIAKVREESGGRMTAPGMLLGTPGYMAPEQARGANDVDARTDIFALGATLFELLTGQNPFFGKNVMAVLAKILFEEAPALPHDRASPELHAVVHRCLAKAPEDRYSSAIDLMTALVATPEGREGYTAPRIPSAPAPQKDNLVARDETQETFLGDDEVRPSIINAARSEALDLKMPSPSALRESPSSASPQQPHSDLDRYLNQAGLMLRQGQGPLLAIDRRPDCRLPPMRLWAILLEPEDQPLATRTMATIAFQRDARPLYALSGTDESPHHVLALFRNPPGAGVYREWHDLATRRHVYVSPVSPSALRAAVEANRAVAHLQELVRRGRRDPFELEGRVVTDLDFFGGRDDLQAFLHLIDGASAGIGLFGLEKWGTTSLLFRARAELSNRFSAWVDLAALPSLTLAAVLSAIYEDFANGLIKRGSTAPVSAAAQEDMEVALLRVLDACHAASGARPVIFLDRVDELQSRERCSHEAIIAIARALYRLAFPPGERSGAVLVFGGREAHLLSSRTLGTQDNPLWGAVAVRYASFFSREEMGDFMQRLGALGGLSFSHDALDKAFELTFGHKYLSRRLGSLLYQRGPLGTDGTFQVTPDHVSACTAPLVTRHHAYFDAVLRRGPPAIRALLARLAQAPSAIEELFASETVRAAGNPLAALDFAGAYRLALEEEGRYRLTIGLFEAWLRWTHDPQQKNERRPSPPPPPPNPSASEIQALETLIREGFSSPGELELLARRMHVVLANVVRLSMPLPNQIGDLVDWAVKHRRFGDLLEAVRIERPGFFAGGVGQTQVMKVRSRS